MQPTAALRPWRAMVQRPGIMGLGPRDEVSAHHLQAVRPVPAEEPEEVERQQPRKDAMAPDLMAQAPSQVQGMEPPDRENEGWELLLREAAPVVPGQPRPQE